MYFRYLLRQNTYEPEDITIITMYTGQLLLIKRKMPKVEFEGVKITSVDNFQGKVLLICKRQSYTTPDIEYREMCIDFQLYFRD